MAHKIDTAKPLPRRAKALLLEAARRWLNGDDITKAKGLRHAWTGLGNRTTYKPVADLGLMEIAEGHHYAPRCMGWWTLTDAGAAIVQDWLDAGLTLKNFEPPTKYPGDREYTHDYALFPSNHVHAGNLPAEVAGA
jgi:hypothetical protein